MLFFHVGDVPGAISVAFTDVRHIGKSWSGFKARSLHHLDLSVRSDEGDTCMVQVDVHVQPWRECNSTSGS